VSSEEGTGRLRVEPPRSVEEDVMVVVCGVWRRKMTK